MVDNTSLGRAAEILLVEDNPDDVQLTRLALQQTEIDHSLHVVHDGREALAFLRCEGNFNGKPRPDLILLDLNMPIMDGREVLRHVKQDPTLRRIPVIILTTSDSAADRLVAYDHHANAYLVKPLELADLFAMVRGIANFWFDFVRHSPS